jgi:hypothetical protein
MKNFGSFKYLKSNNEENLIKIKQNLTLLIIVVTFD